MTRLLRLSVVVCLLSARSFAAPAPPSASAPEVRAAKAQAAACPKAKLPAPVCRQAAEIVSAYLLELKTAEQCRAKPCPVKKVQDIFTAVHALDVQESKLPDPARSTGNGRPMLRLSLLITRWAAAALSAADPKALPPFRYDPAVDAPRQVEDVCQNSPKYCSRARAVLAAVKTVDAETSACA
ncbi:MAG: hypothetical protein KGL74_06810, partial [Elusimicrobia bacterium]|nr:hypothetical protein [Elusimicrobiota bacterium]